MKKFFKAIGNYFKQTDLILWAMCFLATGIGLIMLTGIVDAGILDKATHRTLLVQLGAASMGIICAIVLSKIDYNLLAHLYKFHSVLGYGLVLLTFFIGAQRSGADDKSWILLPMGMSLQPTELLKISFILTFAYHLDCVKDEINTLKNVFFLCLHGAVPILLIHFQGDDGTAVIFAVIFLFMLFSAGINWKYILGAGIGAVIAIPVFWFGIMNYDQKMRILTIFNPELDPKNIGYQQLQARLAIGSGQVWGKGIFGVQHKYVPELHNDFIFAFIAESIGFIGCLGVVTLLTAIALKVLFTGLVAVDNTGKFICVGVFAMLASQTIFNIGMCLSLLPVIGITLPFLSAGGTSTLSLYLGIGLVMSVYMHSNKNLFLNR